MKHEQCQAIDLEAETTHTCRLQEGHGEDHLCSKPWDGDWGNSTSYQLCGHTWPVATPKATP